jgi:hypothetical protein
MALKSVFEAQNAVPSWKIASGSGIVVSLAIAGEGYTGSVTVIFGRCENSRARVSTT